MKKKTLEMANAFKTSFSTNTESIANAKKLTNEIIEMAKAGKTYEEAGKWTRISIGTLEQMQKFTKVVFG